MITTYRLYVAAAVAAGLLLIAMSIGPIRSNIRQRRLEGDLEIKKAAAAEAVHTARVAETEAAKFEEKITYLERNLEEISRLAAKQYEELEALSTEVRTARDDVRRARGVRTAASTADELCRKLAGLGHGCEPADLDDQDAPRRE